MSDIHRLIELQKLLLDFSNVERVVHRKHQGKKYVLENDTEHSYNLAMAAWFLVKWFPRLDKNLLIQYALIHDFVEVHAGDTYIYGNPDQLDSKVQREAEALKKLEKDWADFPDMIESIHTYEDKTTPEARFVYALDKLMPVMVIYIHKGYTWKKKLVTAKMLYDHKLEQVSKSPEVLPYFIQLHELLLAHPEIIKAS